MSDNDLQDTSQSDKKISEVYFFGTCLIDLIYPNAGMSGIKLLEREGIKVIYPQQQTCCGQPAWNSGYRDEARDVAALQLSLFNKDIPIVVPSGSCAGMMKTHYPALFIDNKLESQALNHASRVYELTEFLVDVLNIQLEDLGEPQEIAIHTSCAARREMGVADKIESLVAQLSNVTVLEQEHKAECCGFGGTFAVKEAKISASMVADKTANIRNTGATQLISQDAGCLMNISGAFDHQADVKGKGPDCDHIANFLWERTHAK
jgi:L-lactate dehydrogenase complex protein LldE